MQLSRIKAVVVTRSSYAEQSQVFVSPSQYFLRPQLGWNWAAIPYKSCCCHKKLLRGAVESFISPSQYFLRPQPWLNWVASSTFNACWISVDSLPVAFPQLRNRYRDILGTTFFWDLHQNQLFPRHRTEFERFTRTQDPVENTFFQPYYRVVQLNLGCWQVRSSRYRTLEFLRDVFFSF